MAEGIDVVRLGERLRRLRRKRGLTLREVAKETRITIATLSRIERGASREVQSSTLLGLAEWMGTGLENLRERPAPVVRRGKVIEDTAEIVELHLRADKKLDKKTAAALANLFRTAYELAMLGEKK